MFALISRLGIRGQLLVAPAIILILMTVLGLAGRRALQDAADTARDSAAETKAVEVLRDSNTEMFEGHRFQALALAAAERKEFDEMVDEDADVMQESIDGFKAFARVARTPDLRRQALAQAALVGKIEADRAQLFALATPGRSLPAAAEPLVDAIEADIEASDASNDKLVEAEEVVTDAIAADAQASARSAERLIALLLGLAVLLGVGVSLLIGPPARARRACPASRGPAGSPPATSISSSTPASAASWAPPPRRSSGMVDYLRTIERAGGRIADGDLSVDVTPTSADDALGHAFERMTVNLRQMIGDVAATAAAVSESSESMTGTCDEAGSGSARSPTRWARSPRAPSTSCACVGSATESAAEMARAVDASAEAAQQSAGAAREARELAREGVIAVGQATTAMTAVRESTSAAVRGDRRAGGQVRARSARSSRASPRSPSRRTCSRSTRRSRPPAPASTGAASRSSPRRSAASPRPPPAPRARSGP